MSIAIDCTLKRDPKYPESDGHPMCENTLQFECIRTIIGGLEVLFRDRADVFVAGDLFWYPVEGTNTISRAPDAMVVFGRPKGHRSSYLQWQEGGIAPQVIFEMVSPGNGYANLLGTFQFYERYGVEEYYAYNPEMADLSAWLRRGASLKAVSDMNGWISPRLGIRFDMSSGELRIFRPDGQRLLTYAELAAQRECAEQERDRLAAKLRSLGVDPEA